MRLVSSSAGAGALSAVAQHRSQTWYTLHRGACLGYWGTGLQDPVLVVQSVCCGCTCSTSSKIRKHPWARLYR